MKIFISYGHDKDIICHEIKDALTKRGFDVWIDSSEIKVGNDWRAAITKGILDSHAVVACLSERSVRKNGVCLNELAIAIGYKYDAIRTVLLDEETRVEPPASICSLQWLDMHEYEQKRKLGEENYRLWFESRMDELYQALCDIHNSNINGEMQEIKNTLNPQYSFSMQTQMLKSTYTGRQWLSQEITEWISSRNTEQICMILGEPGIGKTHFIVDYVHTHPEVAVCLYCNANQKNFSNPENIVRTLAYLLACRLPNYRLLLNSILGSMDQKLNAAELFVCLIAEPLKDYYIDGGQANICIVIDALDESGDGGKYPLANMLFDNVPRLPEWLKILVTTRNLSYFINTPDQCKRIFLKGKDEKNMQDICGYIQESVGGKLMESEIQAIANKSEGIFLYAKLVVDMIRTEKFRAEELETIPDGLANALHLWFEQTFPDLKLYGDKYGILLGIIASADSMFPVEEIAEVMGWRHSDANTFLLHTEAILETKMEHDEETVDFTHHFIVEWIYSKKAMEYRIYQEDIRSFVFKTMRKKFCEEGELSDFEIQFLFRTISRNLADGSRSAVRVFLRMTDLFDQAFRTAVRFLKRRNFADGLDLLQNLDRLLQFSIENAPENADSRRRIQLQTDIKMADVMVQTGQYAKAEEVLKRSFSLAEDCGDMDFLLSLLDVNSSLIHIYTSSHYVEDAIAQLDKCLGILEECRGESIRKEHLLIMLRQQIVLAQELIILCLYPRAEALLDCVIAEAEQRIQDGQKALNRILGRALEQKGVIYAEKRDRAQAYALYCRAVDCYSSCMADYQEDDLAYLDYGLSYKRRAEQEMAFVRESKMQDSIDIDTVAASIDKALDIYSRIEKRTPEFMDTYGKIGFACTEFTSFLLDVAPDDNRIPQYLERALDAMEKASLLSNQRNRQIFNILSHINRDYGKWEERNSNFIAAEEYYRDAIDAGEKSCLIAPRHPYSPMVQAIAYGYYAAFLERQNRLDEAAENRKLGWETLAIAKKLAPGRPFADVAEILQG